MRPVSRIAAEMRQTNLDDFILLADLLQDWFSACLRAGKVVAGLQEILEVIDSMYTEPPDIVVGWRRGLQQYIGITVDYNL